MNKVIELLKTALHYFAVITLVVMVVAAGYITIFYGGNAMVEAKILWQILLVSFLSSLCNFFFYSRKKSLEKQEILVRWILAYVYVNAVVLGSGFAFEWFDIESLPMVIGMLVAVIAAFVLIRGCIFLFDLKTTDKINRKLRERNGEE